MRSLRRYRRRSARVLVVDGTDRVLLLRSASGTTGHCWLTPGGGVRSWESLRRAAARELAEEIGLVVPARDLRGPVALSAGHADLGWARGTFRDDFFVHRVTSHEVDTARMERLERAFHAGHRWWSVEDLADTTETVYPFGLVPLLTDLLAGRFPDRPVRLPWHH
nr:NUDIX domain-containing protein [Micromonospora sp. DSM 115978]